MPSPSSASTWERRNDNREYHSWDNNYWACMGSLEGWKRMNQQEIEAVALGMLNAGLKRGWTMEEAKLIPLWVDMLELAPTAIAALDEHRNTRAEAGIAGESSTATVAAGSEPATAPSLPPAPATDQPDDSSYKSLSVRIDDEIAKFCKGIGLKLTHPHNTPENIRWFMAMNIAKALPERESGDDITASLVEALREFMAYHNPDDARWHEANKDTAVAKGLKALKLFEQGRRG